MLKKSISRYGINCFFFFKEPRALHSPLNKQPFINNTGGGWRSLPIDVLVDFNEQQQHGRNELNKNEYIRTPLNQSKPSMSIFFKCEFESYYLFEY